MTLPDRPISAGLRLILAASAALQPLAPMILRRRLARGKELPGRWREKLGYASQSRPDGPLVWLHAVGLGEVMALRGLIAAMGKARPDLSFLVTSTARSSAEIFATHLGPRCQHQFLPLDMPGPVARFLAHWRPDLVLWSEQDIWPRLVLQTHRQAVPQLWVNARMNAAAYRRRARMAGASRDVIGCFHKVLAQDQATARHISQLCATVPVATVGSLKAGAGAPAPDGAALQGLRQQLAGRPVWVAGPSHAADEQMALAAHAAWRAQHPDGLLIVAPRLPQRRAALQQACAQAGLAASLRSAGWPARDVAVYIADSFGEMSLWYSVAQAALVGGSFAPQVQGHNPWEAVGMGCPVMHGPHTENFAQDYTDLAAAQGAIAVANPDDILAALARPDLPEIAARAARLRQDLADTVRITCDAALAGLAA